MGNVPPQFEQKDLLGSQTQFAGVVGTTPIKIPGSPGNRIAKFIVGSPSTELGQSITAILSVSVDGGTTYWEIASGSEVWGPLRGIVTQIDIKGNEAGVKYQIMLAVENV